MIGLILLATVWDEPGVACVIQGTLLRRWHGECCLVERVQSAPMCRALPRKSVQRPAAIQWRM